MLLESPFDFDVIFDFKRCIINPFSAYILHFAIRVRNSPKQLTSYYLNPTLYCDFFPPALPTDKPTP